MALITFEDLPSTNTPLNAANLNNNFNELNNKTAGTILWEGTSTAETLATDLSIPFSTAELRPYNYTFCYGIFYNRSANSYHFFPFYGTHATNLVFYDYFGNGAAYNCYLRIGYNGYGAMSWRVQSINGMTVTDISLIKIIGVK